MDHNTFQVEKRTIDGKVQYIVVINSTVPGAIITGREELTVQMFAAKMNEAFDTVIEEFKFNMEDCFARVEQGQNMVNESCPYCAIRGCEGECRAKDARRRSRDMIGQPGKTRVIPDKRRKPPKHKKRDNASDM